MKKSIIGLAVMIGFGLSSCAHKGIGAGSGSNDNNMCGAYAGYRSLTEADIHVFKSAYTFKPRLTPHGVATQVVAGTNYKFICTNESGNDVKVVVFKPLPNKGKARVSSVEMVSVHDTPEIVAINAQIMYHDIMSMYHSGEDGQKHAFSKYASATLQDLLRDVDEAIAKGEIEPMVYGWDCDPWIMAQDWNHPVAKVVKVHDLSGNRCMADVVITDGEAQGNPTNITIALVKEDNQWKVCDFASSKFGAGTFARMLKADYESAKANDNK